MSEVTTDTLGVDDPLLDTVTDKAAVGDLLTRSAQVYGERIALVEGAYTFTYRKLEARANAVARGLLGQGLSHGDTLALHMGNCPEFLITFFACAKVGAIVVPLNPQLPARELKDQIIDFGIQAIVTEEDYLSNLEEALEEAEGANVQYVEVVDPSPASVSRLPAYDWIQLLINSEAALETAIEDHDRLQYLYSPDTTSAPERTLANHATVRTIALDSASYLGLRQRDHGAVMPVVLPLFHPAGLHYLTLPVLLSGGTVILHRQFDANEVLNDIDTRRATHFMGPATMWKAILNSQRVSQTDTTSLQMAVVIDQLPAQEATSLRRTFSHADIVMPSARMRRLWMYTPQDDA